MYISYIWKYFFYGYLKILIRMKIINKKKVIIKWMKLNTSFYRREKQEIFFEMKVFEIKNIIKSKVITKLAIKIINYIIYTIYYDNNKNVFLQIM